MLKQISRQGAWRNRRMPSKEMLIAKMLGSSTAPSAISLLPTAIKDKRKPKALPIKHYYRGIEMSDKNHALVC
jgi:hypothetical protein